MLYKYHTGAQTVPAGCWGELWYNQHQISLRHSAPGVLGLTVLKRNLCGMNGTFGNSPKQAHSSLFSSPAILLFDTIIPVLLLRTWPRSSRIILSTRAELFVPSVLVGRCKVITSTEISSILQEKPTEHFVMYREILVQPFSWQNFRWSNGNVLAVAGRSSALRVGWFLAPQSRWNSLSAGQGKSPHFLSPFLSPQRVLEIPALILTP